MDAITNRLVRQTLRKAQRNVAKEQKKKAAEAKKEEAKNLKAFAKLIAREEVAAGKAESKRQKVQAREENKILQKEEKIKRAKLIRVIRSKRASAEEKEQARLAIVQMNAQIHSREVAQQQTKSDNIAAIQKRKMLRFLTPFQRYYESNVSSTLRVSNRTSIKYLRTRFPIGYIHLADYGAKIEGSNAQFLDKFKEVMTFLESKKTDRTTMTVTMEITYRKKATGTNEYNVFKSIITQSPMDQYKHINEYNSGVIDFKCMYYELAEVPLKGACDTRPHEVTMQFQTESDDSLFSIKVSSVKSSGDNCLINALSQANANLGKGFRAQKIREELKLEAGPIATEKCAEISQKLGVTYALFRINEEKLEIVCESDTISDQHVNLLLIDGHYWKITSDLRDIRSMQFKQSMQIQENEKTCQLQTQKIVELDQILEEQDYESIQFKDVVENPSIQAVAELVKSGSNLLIVGAGGCGKTYILKQLNGPKVSYTATTACAADLLGGCTIQSYMIKNKNPKDNIVIVDEISMMGACLFERVFEWANREDKQNAQLILSGDFLQLPPVNDLFFFQASSFFAFAKSAVLVKLTEVKRQEDVDQIEFLNKLRVGQIDKEYIKGLTNNRVEKPQLVLAAKRDFVQQYNMFKMKDIGTAILDYPSYKMQNGKRLSLKSHNKLCAGAKAMITKNIRIGEDYVFNGMRVTIVCTSFEQVSVVDENGNPYTIKYLVDEDVQFLPVEACYALTIHKSQGQTVDSAVVHVDGLFEQGMAYVALSRVRDLKNLQIKDTLNFSEKGWQPNKMALEFYNGGKTVSADQMLFIPNTKKQLKGIRRNKWDEPIWNHIYIDFETYLNGSVQKTYYNHLLHMHGEEKVYTNQYFDQLWDGGNRCDVDQETWNYIRNVACNYGDDIAKAKEDKNKIALVKKLRKEIPTIVAFNGSGFDLHFLVQKYLNDKICSGRFKLNMIYKGTSLIFFQVFDRISQEVVLKTHDMFQIVGCSLAAALKNFCGSQGKQLAEKIEFKDEIMHIYNNYHSNPDILRPGVVTKIMKKVYTDIGIDFTEVGKEVSLFDEVIKYADNDTKVLPILYKCMDQLTKEVLGSNVTSFLTAGSMAWYGFVSNLPEECTEVRRNEHSNKISQQIINTKLYKCEKNQEEFIRKSIKGGRVCPRQHVVDSKIDGDKYVYLDISGMYASIMKNNLLPYGKAIWMNEAQTKVLENTAQNIRKDNYEKIFDKITKSFGLFIAEVEFEENHMNLEPVVQFKKNGKTVYTVERRTDVITSVDVALIIASGGKIHKISKILTWENKTQIMNPWILKANALKKEGELTGNGAKKSFGKLLANSAYGQTLKRDRNEVVKIVSTWDEADNFVNSNTLKDIFQVGEFDVIKGEKKVSQESFITSRCSFIGSFILGYTRAMIHEICEIACPNRYNEKGINEQPVYGDTDSLVFREWQANLLVQAGWIQKENGKLTDELCDDNGHWFMPSRLQGDIERLDTFNDLAFSQSPGMSMQQDYIWSNATEQEKRDPENFQFWYVEKGIFSAPKSYACQYTDHNGVKSKEKIKFKGIPATALINAKKLDFNQVLHAYQAPGSQKAVLQGAPQVLKTFTKTEGAQMFSQVVDSNMRRGKAVTRALFKTVWQGRKHITENVTVPWGWNEQ